MLELATQRIEMNRDSSCQKPVLFKFTSTYTSAISAEWRQISDD